MSDSTSNLPVLGYWDLRGRCEYIRDLLAYTGTKYHDKRYPFEGDPVDAKSEEWFQKDKFSLGLDFPNLPYYIDGEVKLTQSLAILRHLGRKNGLAGKTEEDRIRIDLAQEQITDMRSALRNACASDDFEKAKKTYLESLPAQLKQVSDFLGDRDFIIGKSISFVDFFAYEVLDTIRAFAPECFNEFKNLVGYVTRIENIPAIKEHQSSKLFRKNRLFGPILKWGYSD